jgi:hypothetical protein
MESAQPERWTLFPQSAAAPAALGALASGLEKPRETVESRVGPYRYPQQVSKVNSL